jgi:predicted hydrocarbon binding protein
LNSESKTAVRGSTIQMQSLKTEDSPSPWEEKSGISRAWTINFDSTGGTPRYFEFNLKRGTITNRLRNQRIFLLAGDTWAEMEAGMRETFGTSAYVFLERMGRNYGASVARKLKTKVKSLGILKQLAASAGYGTFSMRADEETGAWIRVHALDCVFCHGFNEDHDCTFLSGIIQGMAEEFYGKEYMILRRKCYSSPMTGHICEIVLQESTYDFVARKRRPVSSKKYNPLGEDFR